MLHNNKIISMKHYELARRIIEHIELDLRYYEFDDFIALTQQKLMLINSDLMYTLIID